MQSRDDVVDLAQSFDGLRAPDEAYVELLMPASIETRENRAAARMAAPITLPSGKVLKPWSSCALFVRSLWRLLGAEHERLRRPYVNGRAVIDVKQIALDAGAWHEHDDGTTPAPGDVILVGEAGHEHVAVLLELDPTRGDGMRVVSIDGGQGPLCCAIERRRRLWPSWSDRWRDQNDLGTERPVMGWADTMAVLAA